MANENTLLIKQKNVYGNTLIYPACPVAETFAALVGQKTFSVYHLRLIKQLGYDIQQAAPDALAGV